MVLSSILFVEGYHYFIIIFTLAYLFNTALEVNGNQCDNGMFCPPPKVCCEGACCLLYEHPYIPSFEGPNVPDLPLTYYRLPTSFWNVWYFWFIVIFLIIACFGACGYWRRRHVRVISSSVQRRRCNSHIPIQDDPQGDTDLQPSCHPPLRFLPTRHILRPPAYSEVTSKPDMYPLVQGGQELLKNDTMALVYATTPFIHSYMPYNPGVVYLSSPAESNSSIFQSTTASNYAYPPPYSDGMYGPASVSTPGSILSACTPTEHRLTTHFLTSVSPPMATTPTSQQYFSEVSTPAGSITSPTAFINYRFGPLVSGASTPRRESFDGSPTGEMNLFANLVADIQNMTNRMMRSPVLSDIESEELLDGGVITSDCQTDAAERSQSGSSTGVKALPNMRQGRGDMLTETWTSPDCSACAPKKDSRSLRLFRSVSLNGHGLAMGTNGRFCEQTSNNPSNFPSRPTSSAISRSHSSDNRIVWRVQSSRVDNANNLVGVSEAGARDITRPGTTDSVSPNSVRINNEFR